LSPNTNSLCCPWLPENGIQGHFSIYCRLFPLGASSNSLRNLLEVSCNIFHSIIYLRNLLECSTPVALTAELDLIVRALEILSGQLLSSCPPLTNSGPLIALLQERCCSLQTFPSRHRHLGLPAAPSPRANQMTECFGTHYQYYPHGPDSPATTTHSTHNWPCPRSSSRFASNTYVSSCCYPSFSGPGHPVQIADEAKTPFSPRLLW